MARTKKHRKDRGSVGRPKAARVRDHCVSFRVTAEELLELMDKAQRSGMSHGEFARTKALHGIARARKAAPATSPVFAEATRDIFHEVRRQGVNLNQIAHHCNRHQLPPPRELVDLAAKLLALWERLLEKA